MALMRVSDYPSPEAYIAAVPALDTETLYVNLAELRGSAGHAAFNVMRRAVLAELKARGVPAFSRPAASPRRSAGRSRRWHAS